MKNWILLEQLSLLSESSVIHLRFHPAHCPLHYFVIHRTSWRSCVDPPQPSTHGPLSSTEVLQGPSSGLQGVIVLALRQQR